MPQILEDSIDSVEQEEDLFNSLPNPQVEGHLTLPLTPTAFIFPSKSGNSILFSIQGFTLLINGGNDHIPFWPLIRHLNRLDCCLLTNDNEPEILESLGKMFKRKKLEKGENNNDNGTNQKNEKSLILGSFLINSLENKISNSKLLKKIVKLTRSLNIATIFLGKNKGAAVSSIAASTFGNRNNGQPNILKPTNIFYNIGVGSLDIYSLNQGLFSGCVLIFSNDQGQNANKQKENKPKSASEKSQILSSLPTKNIRMLCPGNLSFKDLNKCVPELQTIPALKNYSIFYQPRSTLMVNKNGSKTTINSGSINSSSSTSTFSQKSSNNNSNKNSPSVENVSFNSREDVRPKSVIVTGKKNVSVASQKTSYSNSDLKNFGQSSDRISISTSKRSSKPRRPPLTPIGKQVSVSVNDQSNELVWVGKILIDFRFFFVYLLIS